MKPKGCVAVYINLEGRVIASVSDFRPDGYGGFTLYESQRIRAKSNLCREVIKTYCSPVVYDVLEAYDCEQIVGKMKGKIEFIEIGADASDVG